MIDPIQLAITADVNQRLNEAFPKENEPRRQKPILCLDFDGVIHSYSSGWQGASTIPDPPVPGALEFIVAAQSSFSVAIFSSRNHQALGIEAMRFWLQLQFAKAGMDLGEIGQVIENIDFPVHKPSAMITIDDRALTFTGEWPNIDSLLAFKPWNKK